MKWDILKLSLEENIEILIENTDINLYQIVDDICIKEGFKYKCIYGYNILFDPEYRLNEDQLKTFEQLIYTEIKSKYQEYLDTCIRYTDNKIEIPIFLFEEHNIDNIFSGIFGLEPSYDMIDNNIVFEIFQLENNNKFKKTIITRLKEIITDVAPTLEDEFSPVDITEYSSEAIMLSFVIKDELINIIDYLYEFDYPVNIYENQTEYDLINEIDYDPNRISNNFLIHDIRKPNLIIAELPSNYIGLFIIGYIEMDDKIEITIKAFHYNILEMLYSFFRERTQIIENKGNLGWEKLLSRLVDEGYRESNSHIKENTLAKKFLEETKKEYYEDELQYILSKLLQKGYLTLDEYNKEFEKLDGTKKSIAKQNKISKYFIEYLSLTKSDFKKKYSSYLFSVSSGKVYGNAKEKSDTKKMYEIKCSRVYAPSEDLLHYIRAYWHQQFVENIIYKIKGVWENEEDGFEIIEYIRDKQFDFLNEDPEKTTKDIDILVRVANTKTREEYIIAIEAKRNLKDYAKEMKDIPKKIDLTYAKIFSGFILIGYFDDMSEDHKLLYNKPADQILSWMNNSDDKESSNFNKPFYFVQSTSFAKLVNDVKNAITDICNR